MNRYTQYVFQNLIRKKTTWVAAGVFLLYIFLIILLVPAILHFSPMFIWTNTIIDIHAFNLIILSIYCATACVVIFNDSREDGTELVIMSKPINRWKVIVAKFICFLGFSLMIVIFAMVLMTCTLFFGKQTPSHQNGVDSHTLGNEILSLFIGSLIVIIFFGGIAILISAFAGKIGIMITTIGISVGLNIVYTVMPLIATGVNTYLERKLDVTLDSYSYLTVGKSENISNTNLVDVISASHTAPGKSTYNYAKEAEKHDTTWMNAYVNVGAQMSSLFRPASSSSYKIEERSDYGEYNTCHYSITGTQPVTKAASIDNFPIVEIDVNTYQAVNTVRYILYGNHADLSYLSIIGGSPDDIAMISPTNISIANLGSGFKFYSMKELTTYYEPDVIADYVGFPNGDALSLWGEFGTDSEEEITSETFRDYIIDTFITYRGVLDGIDIYRAFLGHSFPDDYLNNKTVDEDIDKIALMCSLLLKQAFAQRIFEMFSELADGSDFTAVTDKDVLDYINEKDNKEHAKILANDHAVTLGLSTSGFAVKNAPTYSDDNRHVSLFKSAIDGTNRFNDMYTYKAELYMNKENVIIFWSIFSFLLFSISVVIYARTDIK